MEIRYPYLIIIIIILFIVYYLFFRKNTSKFLKGIKITNTSFLKDTDYFKYKMKKFNFYKRLIFILFIICFICSSILIMRLSSVKTIKNNEHNLDIFLCMDVSSSVDAFNLDLIDDYKEMIKNFHNKRLGISIFNSSSIVLSPLTEDYDYINDVLNKITKSIVLNDSFKSNSYIDDNYLYLSSYIYSGTLEGNSIRGSSLIGDGLASCINNFSDDDFKSTKIIILSTDNNLEGNPIVSLEEAARISKSKNIIVYGIGTNVIDNENKKEFINAVKVTDGKYYDYSDSSISSIIEDIYSFSKTSLNKHDETRKIDIPEIPFIILCISLIGIFILRKKVS